MLLNTKLLILSTRDFVSQNIAHLRIKFLSSFTYSLESLLPT